MSLDLSVLNPEQREAVVNVDGPLLIIAGAGSGKTRVITYRIANLILEHNVSPWHIFAATFTNKAADEMKRRVGELIGGQSLPNLAISTFHSLCASILRREAERVGLTSSFSICDEEDQLSLIKSVMKALDMTDKEVEPKLIRWLINQCKMKMQEFEEIENMFFSPSYGEYISVMTEYKKRLHSSNAVDFGDLLLYVVRIFEKNPEVLENYQNRFRYVLVDEYQDTNAIQFRLVHMLSLNHNNICVVGDEDQSIYSWRGATLANLLDFQKVYPTAKVVRLEQNYRSTSVILDAASEIIKHNKERLGKVLWTTNEGGDKIKKITTLNEIYEAQEVASEILSLVRAGQHKYCDVAIFYRVNALSRVFEDEFRRSGIMYKIVGGIRFYDRKEIKDLIAYLRVVANPHDSISLERIINVPRRGIGDTTISKIRKIASKSDVSFFEAIKILVGDEKGVAPQTAKKLNRLLAMVETWQGLMNERSVMKLTEKIIADTGYYDFLMKDKRIDGVDRRENIGEFLTAMEQFATSESEEETTLYHYLENISLVTSTDDFDESADSVSLMTIHCAKGLEFPVVFVVGLEHPIFPNQRAMDESESIEEERRLFYVAITRAKEKLYVSRADSRRVYGRTNWNLPSVFLDELPEELVEEM